jgi:hypothetical protein
MLSFLCRDVLGIARGCNGWGLGALSEKTENEVGLNKKTLRLLSKTNRLLPAVARLQLI